MPLPLLMCILSYKYLLQGCLLLSNFVLTRFSIRVYRPKSLTPSVAHYASLLHSFCLTPLLILLCVDVNTRRTLPLPLDHSLFTCPALHSLDHLCRCSPTLAVCLSLWPTSSPQPNLFTILQHVRTFFFSLSH